MGGGEITEDIGGKRIPATAARARSGKAKGRGNHREDEYEEVGEAEVVEGHLRRRWR